MTTLATLVVKIAADMSGLVSDLEDGSRRVRAFGGDMERVGQNMTGKVTLPIVAAGTAAVVMGNQLNAGLANVISLAPSAAGEIEGMRDDLQALAVESGKSTGDMTDGLYQVVSAFGYGSDSLEILRTNALAGAAGLATTTDAINLTSAVTKAYGDTSADAVAQVADLAMQTVALGQTTFPELAASVGRVTPLAASMGVSMNELFGVMATGTGVTGSAAEVSTQFRGILQSLMAPTEDMTAAFAELGVTSGQQLIDIYGLEDGLHNIMQIAEASGKPLQSFISSIEGQTLAMALAGPQADAWSEKTQAMRESAGAMATAFEAQTQGVNEVGFAMQQGVVQIQTMAQDLGQALMPAIVQVLPYVRQLIGFVQGMVQRFTELDPKTQTIILGVIAFVAALGPLLMVLGPIVSGIGAVGAVIGALLSPVGLIIAAVAALAVAWATDFGGIRTTVTAWWNEHVGPVLEKVGAWLKENIPLAIATLKQAWIDAQPTIDTIKRIFGDIGEVLGKVFSWLYTNVPRGLKVLKDRLIDSNPAVQTLLGLFRDIVTVLGDVAMWMIERIPDAVEAVKKAFDGAVEGIQNVIDRIRTFIDGVMEAIAKLREFLGLNGSFSSSGGSGYVNSLPGPGGGGYGQPSTTPGGGGYGTTPTRGAQGAGMTVYLTINAAGAEPMAVGRAAEMGVLRAARSLGLA